MTIEEMWATIEALHAKWEMLVVQEAEEGKKIPKSKEDWLALEKIWENQIETENMIQHFRGVISYVMERQVDNALEDYCEQFRNIGTDAKAVGADQK